MNDYILKDGENINEDFLEEIMKLDEMVYQKDVQGNLTELKERFITKKQKFLLLYQKKNLIGYICFFPITKDTTEKIYSSNQIYEHHIKAKNITDYQKDIPTDIYIISVVIKPRYQNTSAIRILTNGFINYLKKKKEDGYLLNKLIASTTSDDGFKFLNNLNFKQIKTLENNYKLMECNFDNLRSIHFGKTYKDDFYIMIPLTGEMPKIEKKENEIGNYYVDTLNEFSDYECNNKISKSLTRNFLEELPLGCIDDYDTKQVLQTQNAYLFLTSHISTKLHILTLLVPNNKMSTTILQDQTTSDNLYIKVNEGWQNLIEYIFNKYKLQKCGEPKTVLCLSNKPQNINEMYAMLASEAYDGEYILKYENNYLTSSKLKEISENNISQYAFYESYTSEVSVLYILSFFNEKFQKNLEYEALVLFVVELIIFQCSAINRTNQKIVEELSKEGNVSLKTVENLYTELGKTVIFWNNNNFYYSSSQNFANSLYKAFKTHENFELYEKNQHFLEHIVDLKNAQATNRENKILNIIVILLTCLQVIPIIISFITWLLDITSYAFIGTIGTSSTLLIIILIVLIKRNKQTSKK